MTDTRVGSNVLGLLLLLKTLTQALPRLSLRRRENQDNSEAGVPLRHSSTLTQSVTFSTLVQRSFVLVILSVLLPDLGFSESDGSVFFQDRSKTTGIDFRLENSPTPKKFLIETMTGGCAFLDYDGDGLLDIFLVNGASLHIGARHPKIDKSEPRYWNRLYRNLGAGRFQDVTQEAGVSGRGYGLGAAVGDYDNNGHPDLYITNYGRNELYRNLGNGTFKEVTREAGVKGGGFSASAAFFDFDRDGLLDLYVCRYVDWSFQNNKRCGAQNQRDYCDPGMFNGLPDLLFRNNGNGTFSDVSYEMGIALPAGKGLGIALGDVNRDGWLDVFVANDKVPSFLFLNQNGRSFQEVGLESGVALNANGGTFAGMGTDVADYDNDCWPDIFVNALSLEGFVLFRNEQEVGFSDVSEIAGIKQASFYLAGWGTKFLDFDNDGQKDLFVANGHVMNHIEELIRTLSYDQPLLLLRNSEGRFKNVGGAMGPLFERTFAARGAAFGDYDNDGDVDILVTVLGGNPLLLENLRGNENHWIGFELRGKRSPRDAIGTTLEVIDSEGGKHCHTVSRTSSYLSSSDPRVLMGLGNRKVHSLQIAWPSGTVQQIENVDLNRYHQIQEADGSSATSSGLPTNRTPPVQQ